MKKRGVGGNTALPEGLAMNPEIWRYIFDAIEDPMFLHDEQFRVRLANRAYCRAAGVTEAEALGKPYWEVFPRGSGPLPGCKQTHDDNLAESNDEVVVGEKFFVSKGYPVRDDAGGLLYSLHVLSDLTARGKGEEVLRQSEAKSRLLLDTLPQKIFYKDKDSVYVSCNANYARDLGIAENEIAGRTDFEFYPKELAERYRADDRRLLAAGKTEDIEEPYLQDGKECWVHTVKTPVRDENGEVTGILGIFWDVTTLRQAQAHLARLNRMYRTISLGNQAMVHAADELELAREMCRVLVEEGGFRVAWVGYAEAGKAKRILPVAVVGTEQSEIAAMNLTWEDNEHGHGPTGIAIRTGKIVVSQGVLNDPLWAPWHEQARRLGFAAAAAFPLQFNGKAFGALDIYSAESEVFAPDMLELLAELAGDLAFGIGNFRARAERMGILEKLELSLDHAVTAIAATVEMRDPYTAGHQRRVALLAVAIAQEMGLDESRVEGLRMAGVVHDIGKIHVPAEILSNPGKLTEAEFEIIKTHSQAGYEILKGIDFPWPVADIVWQHHEKLDGSGYPRGLKGDELLLETRILTVADVVEAMASHRPYRPGFGVFPALQEISRQKGRFYDVEVVGACLRVFMEGKYEL